MTTLTYSQDDVVNMVGRWLAARDAEKNRGKTYLGDRPCLPADALIAVCNRIFSKRATKS